MKSAKCRKCCHENSFILLMKKILHTFVPFFRNYLVYSISFCSSFYHILLFSMYDKLCHYFFISLQHIHYTKWRIIFPFLPRRKVPLVVFWLEIIGQQKSRRVFNVFGHKILKTNLSGQNMYLLLSMLLQHCERPN